MKKISVNNIFLFIGLYLTQSLGMGFLVESLIAISRKNGIPLEQLGFIYLIGIAYIFRFLWAPLVDLVANKSGGRYKKILIVFQILSCLSLFSISFFNVSSDLFTIFILGVLVTFFASTQGIATDALICRIFSYKDKGVGNAIKVSSAMAGHLLGSGVALIVYWHFGWQVVVSSLVFLTLIPLVQLFFFDESKVINESYVTNEKISFRVFVDFWKPLFRKKWLLFLIIYPAGMSISYALINPILVDIGWDLDDIGFVVHILGAVTGALGSVATGFLIKKYDRKNIFICIAIMQSAAILLLLLPLYGFSNAIYLFFISASIMALSGASMTITTTAMMDQLDNTTNIATKFSMQSSFYMLVGTIASGVGLWLAGSYGYKNIIILASLFCVLALLYTYRYFDETKETV